MADQTDLNEVEIEAQDNQEQLEQQDEIEIDLDTELIGDELPDVKVSEDEAIEGNEDEDDLLVSNPVRQLRTVNRDLAKKLKLEQQEKLRLQKQLEAAKPAEIEELPPKPQLSDADIEYDPEKFEAKLEAWHEAKSRIERQKEALEQKNRQAQDKFNTKLQKYEQDKVNYKGIDEAEKTVLQSLDVNQQGIVVNYADDPAFVVWALGKNPVALSQLASISDPIEYAIKIREIERKAKEKMTTKKPPAPEKVVTGKTAVPSGYQKQLDKLREQGNVTEAIKLKKQLREKGIDIR